MQEISPNVYIDTSYAGVVLGAINWTHGLVLIDAPFRPDDVRSWRAALLNLGGGVDRMLVNLDAHFDRTLGVRAMESTVVAHEKVAAVYRNRPVTFKSQNAESGADWQLSNGLGSVRWTPPDLTFSNTMVIHWDEDPIILEYHPGPASGASWVVLPAQGIAFVGDAIMVDQPPFLAYADLSDWIDTLKYLLQPEFASYLLVSGRSGLVTQEHARLQLKYLEQVKSGLDALAAKKAMPEETERLIPGLLSGLKYPQELAAHYQQRLHWGLQQNYARNYRQMSVEVEE